MHAQEEFARNAKRLSIEARVMADAGYKLDATKRHKEDAGLGLIESREVIEAYVRSRDQYARILKAKRP
jgi:ribosomal protein L7/L12